MTRILLTTVAIFAITTFYSCQKCTTCQKQTSSAGGACATCSFQSQNSDICESDLTGSGLTIDQYITQIQSIGGSCTKKPGTPAGFATEKLCWTDNTSKNTAILARVTLQGQGYICE
jgi:hypothetical protein